MSTTKFFAIAASFNKIVERDFASLAPHVANYTITSMVEE